MFKTCFLPKVMYMYYDLKGVYFENMWYQLKYEISYQNTSSNHGTTNRKEVPTQTILKKTTIKPYSRSFMLSHQNLTNFSNSEIITDLFICSFQPYSKIFHSYVAHNMMGEKQAVPLRKTKGHPRLPVYDQRGG